MVKPETGNGVFAYPRGRPGRDSRIGEKLPCPVDVDQKLCKLRLDYGISELKKMMVFFIFSRQRNGAVHVHVSRSLVYGLHSRCVTM